MHKIVLPLLFFCAPLAICQTQVTEAAAAAPQLSPQAAYDQATRPLDITRRSPQNWSEVELTALKVARAEAKVACAARKPDQFSGDDLLAMARLCAFAQVWEPVHEAASRYIEAAQAGPTDAKAMTALSTAFDWKVQASLSLQNPDDALATAQTMLRTVPYDQFASEATTSTVRYVHFIHTDQALALLSQRQPQVLAEIKAYGATTQGSSTEDAAGANAAGTTAGAATGAGAGGATGAAGGASSQKPSLPLYVLYSDAIALPTVQQFVNQPKDADAAFTELEAALPKEVPSEDGMFIGEKRRQYLLLGTHLPELHPMGSLVTEDARVPDGLNTRFAYASVFLLFPEWCNQCVAMGFNAAPRASELLESWHVRYYSLLAQNDPPDKRAKAALRDVPLPPSKSSRAGKTSSGPPERLHVDQQVTIQSTPDARLAGTPTLVVPNEALDEFAAADFPLIVATDHDGIIRDLEVAAEDAMAPGGDIDQIAQHILKTWPPD